LAGRKTPSWGVPLPHPSTRAHDRGVDMPSKPKKSQEHLEEVRKLFEQAREGADEFLRLFDEKQVDLAGRLDPEAWRQVLADEGIDPHQANRDLYHYLVGSAIRSALKINEHLAYVDAAGGIEKADPSALAVVTFRVGFYYAKIDDALMRDAPEYRRMIHRERMREVVMTTRHRPDAELKELAIQEAEAKWEQGDKTPHHVMARKLALKYFGKDEDGHPMNEIPLRKRLAPMGHKYGMTLGHKGYRKTK
jgi:hypothetical protein